MPECDGVCKDIVPPLRCWGRRLGRQRGQLRRHGRELFVSHVSIDSALGLGLRGCSGQSESLFSVHLWIIGLGEAKTEGHWHRHVSALYSAAACASLSSDDEGRTTRVFDNDVWP